MSPGAGTRSTRANSIPLYVPNDSDSHPAGQFTSGESDGVVNSGPASDAKRALSLIILARGDHQGGPARSGPSALEHVYHDPDRQPLESRANDRGLEVRERVDSARIVHGAHEPGSQGLLENIVCDAMLTQEAAPRVPIRECQCELLARHVEFAGGAVERRQGDLLEHFAAVLRLLDRPRTARIRRLDRLVGRAAESKVRADEGSRNHDCRVSIAKPGTGALRSPGWLNGATRSDRDQREQCERARQQKGRAERMRCGLVDFLLQLRFQPSVPAARACRWFYLEEGGREVRKPSVRPSIRRPIAWASSILVLGGSGASSRKRGARPLRRTVLLGELTAEDRRQQQDPEHDSGMARGDCSRRSASLAGRGR